MSIRCSATIVKQLLRQLRLAWHCRDTGRIRRLTALVGLAEARLVAELADRPTMCQLPSYSPDYSPIEHLRRNVKREKTHSRYSPTFEALTTAVEAGLRHSHAHPAAVKQLMGTSLEEKAAHPQAAW